MRYFLLLLPLLAGCAGHVNVYGGLAMHATPVDHMGGQNPLGTLGLEYVRDNERLYCGHLSSVPARDGYGLNLCGYEHRLEIQ